MEEPFCVKDLHNGVPLQLAGHGAALRSHLRQPHPEDSALAQPFDEDAFLVGPHQHASLHVAQEPAGEMALALVLDEIGGGEVDALHASRTVQGAAAEGMLGGDPASFGMVDHCAVHQLSSVVKTDHHLVESWRERLKKKISVKEKTSLLGAG